MLGYRINPYVSAKLTRKMATELRRKLLRLQAMGQGWKVLADAIADEQYLVVSIQFGAWKPTHEKIRKSTVEEFLENGHCYI